MGVHLTSCRNGSAGHTQIEQSSGAHTVSVWKNKKNSFILFLFIRNKKNSLKNYRYLFRSNSDKDVIPRAPIFIIINFSIIIVLWWYDFITILMNIQKMFIYVYKNNWVNVFKFDSFILLFWVILCSMLVEQSFRFVSAGLFQWAVGWVFNGPWGGWLKSRATVYGFSAVCLLTRKIDEKWWNVAFLKIEWKLERRERARAREQKTATCLAKWKEIAVHF